MDSAAPIVSTPGSLAGVYASAFTPSFPADATTVIPDLIAFSIASLKYTVLSESRMLAEMWMISTSIIVAYFTAAVTVAIEPVPSSLKALIERIDALSFAHPLIILAILVPCPLASASGSVVRFTAASAYPSFTPESIRAITTLSSFFFPSSATSIVSSASFATPLSASTSVRGFGFSFGAASEVEVLFSSVSTLIASFLTMTSPSFSEIIFSASFIRSREANSRVYTPSK